MQAIQRVPTQLSKLPIPPATLVIDTRGVADDLLETLQIELENFAGDTQLESIQHWRYFSSFIGNRIIEPLGLKAAEALLHPEKSTNSPLQTNAATTHPKTFTGRSDPNPVRTFTSPPYYQEEIQNPPLGQIPNDAFRRNIENCIEQVDDLRNRRINATADLGKSGDFGRHIKDSMVRVMFLTDAKHPDSLTTAAVYAEYLKRYYNKLEHDDHPLALNTTVVCLNHTNWGNPPETLINRLSRQTEDDEWSHINALILSEEYRQDAGRLKEDMQKYIAELLLYIILLIPPSAVRTDAPNTDEQFPNPEPDKLRTRILPPNSYIVGVSAIEHSVRWGRRYLDFGLAEQTLDVLRNRPADDEEGRNQYAARVWLTEWCSEIVNEVPTSIPGDVPALEAFPQAKAIASKPIEQIFRTRGLQLLRHDTTAEDIEQHTYDLARTLIMHSDELKDGKISSSSILLANSETFTFQDSVDNLPQIQQNILMARKKKRGPISPFVELLYKAQRVLSDRRFFLGANGAIERGKRQLNELHLVINQLQDEHDNGLDLEQKRRIFEDSSRSKVTDLSLHITNFPWLASIPVLKTIMAITALVLALLLAITIEVGVFAWLYALVAQLTPGAVVTLDIRVLSLPLLTILLLCIALVTIIIILLNFGRFILSRQRSTRRVETTCWALLVAFGLIGLFVGLSQQWISDPLNLLGPFDSLPLWSGLALVIALIILFIEIFYFFSWSSTLERRRKNVIEEIRREHASIQREVEQYIANTIALDLLKEAGLTDGNRGEGIYFTHMSELSTFVDGVQAEASRQFQRAESSLIIRENATANPSTSALLVRAEQLDVEGLMGNYKLLSEGLAKNREESDELAEALLRAMGTESAVTIEQDLRNRVIVQPTNKVAPPDHREKRNAQILTSTTVSILTRFATITPLSYDDALSLDARYNALDHRVVPMFSTLKPLLEVVKTKAKASKQNSTITKEEVAMAFAWWAQILWEHNVPELNELLNSEGVMAKLQQEKYNPQTVRDTLEILANLVGRPVMVDQVSERYLLMFPSPEGRQFFQNQRMESHFIDFPDVERLVLLYIQHYIAKPTFVPLLQLQAPTGSNDSSIVDATSNGQQGQGASDNSNII